MKRPFLITLTLLSLCTAPTFAQFGKLKQMINKGKDEPAVDTTGSEKKKGGGLSGLLNKAVGSAAKLAGSIGGSMAGLTATTADLNTVMPQVVVMTNLHSKDVNVLQQTFFEGWQPGGNAVMMMFTNKNALQYNKIDGEVLVNGTPANFVTMGVYSAYLKDNTKPKTVSVKSSNGQTASFTLAPPTNTIKLISVNGQANNAPVDLTKDVTLEIETGPTGDNTPVLVMLTGQIIGLRTFYEVGWFEPKSKIVIPSAMFRNMNGVANKINFPNAYIQVSRSPIQKATNVSGAFKEVTYANMITDGKFINVTAKPQFNQGIEIKEEVKLASGNKATIETTKKQALFAPPLSHIKRIGVISFLVQGTTSFYDVKDNKWLDTRTTKSAEFPVFPAEVYQNIMDKMYPQLMDIIKKETGAEIIPIEKMTSSAAYQNAKPFINLAEKVRPDYNFTYKNTKQMVGLKNAADMVGINSPEHKIMAETGANALIRVTINLDMNFEGNDALMIPKLTYEIPGETLGDAYTATYATGTIIAAPFKIPRKGTVSADMLQNDVLKSADLVEGFQKALHMLKEKEDANPDYATEWQTMYNQTTIK